MIKYFIWKNTEIYFLLACISLLLFYIQNSELRTDPRIQMSFTKEPSNDEKLKELPHMKLKAAHEKKYKRLNANVPIDLLMERASYSSSTNCTIEFPKIDQVAFNNIYWQTLSPGGDAYSYSGPVSDAYFYSAYYDNRQLVNTSIRIISFVSVNDISSVKYCQIFYSNEKMIEISEVTYILMDPINGDTENWVYHTYVLSCEIPSKFSNHVPSAVSLVKSKCDVATNVLTVMYNPPDYGKKKDFAICTHPWIYPQEDKSFHLVQYIELTKLLGIDKMFIYKFHSHPNMNAVLRYYEIDDQVEVTPLTMPGRANNQAALMHTLLNIPLRTHRNLFNKMMMASMERAATTDCLYRNMYKYRYVTNMDLDEIMIPSNGESWKEVIDDVINKLKTAQGDHYIPPTGFMVPMGVFSESLRQSWTPDIPKYMSMLQNIVRTGYLKHYKTLVDTERVLGMSNHFPLRCVGECIIHKLEETEGFLAHYRDLNPQGIGEIKSGTPMNITDTRIWHYREDMIKNVDKALMSIGLV